MLPLYPADEGVLIMLSGIVCKDKSVLSILDMKGMAAEICGYYNEWYIQERQDEYVCTVDSLCLHFQLHHLG